MTDPPASPSALGIEAVQWSAHDEEHLTVRITGRWWRRRPTWSGQPVLMIETQGQRHRFPAMPEPPSLSGTPPGTWSFSFSVPTPLAPEPDSRVLLQLGGVVVPLPVADPGGGPPSTPIDPETLSERRVRSAELALDAARKRASEAEDEGARLAAQIEALEHALAESLREPERLQAEIDERDHGRRRAEQRAHAERLLREELQEELMRRAEDRGEAEVLTAELGEARQRIHDVEAQLTQLRRRVDEAEHAAAAARVARDQSEREADRLAEPDVPDVPAATTARHGQPEVLLAEAQLSARSAAPGIRGPAPARLTARAVAIDAGAIVLERALAALPALLVPAPPPAVEPFPPEAAPPAPVAPVPAPRTEPLSSRQLAALRAEFAELRALAERERERRGEAEARASDLEARLGEQTRRAHHAFDALDGLRMRLHEVRIAAAGGLEWDATGQPEPEAAVASEPTVSGEPEPEPTTADREPEAVPPLAGGIEPDRLAAALSRLREAAAAASEPAEAGAEPEAPAAIPAVRSWLEPVFRALTERDPAAAGRLALALLPIQGLVHPDPVAYDLVLDETGCVAVTVADGATRVVLIPSPRAPQDVAFQVTGDLAGLARLLLAGRPRWFRRSVARVTGTRAALEAPARLIRRPLSLAQLHDAGVRCSPVTTLTLVTLMIPPSWTAEERFTIAHRDPSANHPGAEIHVRGGESLTVTEGAALGPAATTIVCSADDLLPTLGGARGPGAEVAGDERPLALMREWLNRAQSG